MLSNCRSEETFGNDSPVDEASGRCSLSDGVCAHDSLFLSLTKRVEIFGRSGQKKCCPLDETFGNDSLVDEAFGRCSLSDGVYAHDSLFLSLTKRVEIFGRSGQKKCCPFDEAFGSDSLVDEAFGKCLSDWKRFCFSFFDEACGNILTKRLENVVPRTKRSTIRGRSVRKKCVGRSLQR